MLAEPSRQRRLLDLQGIDSRIDQLAHAKTRLPQHQQLTELAAEAADVEREWVSASTALSDVQREVDKADGDVQLVRDRAARDRKRLDAGVGTAKDLQAISHELESLARRQGVLEDAQLEVMERAEGLEADVARIGARREALAQRRAELVAARDEAIAELDAQRAQVAVGRSAAVAQVGDELVALYEKIRAGAGKGVAAAELRGRRCGGCGLELNPVELGRIAAAKPDELMRCEECSRIMVRTNESGL